MCEEYLIKNTTKEQRQKIINDALAISLIDANEPSPETMELAQKYVDGQMEISEILKKTIERYKAVNS